MFSYIIKRFLISTPTLFLILLINFFLINIAPGGPLDQMLSMSSSDGEITLEADNGIIGQHDSGMIRKSIEDELKKMYGFDKPLWTRFIETIKNYILFDFGTSIFTGTKVIDIIKSRMPVSFSLALLSTTLIYLIAIPLGIKKAVKSNSKFDKITDIIVNALHAIPSFMIAILLLIFFSGGDFFRIFPTRGFFSDNWDELNAIQKIKDYIMHITLPVTSIVLHNLAFMVFLCKNSFLSEMNKQYVIAAFAKGLSETKVLYGHVFRNAMLITIVNFPVFLVHSFIYGSIVIEIMFSLNGLGLLGFESIINRDYPVILGMLYIFSIFGLLVNILSDILCFAVDKRVNFEGLNP